MEERILTYTTEPPPPRGGMDLWHYDNHLLRIGGPPVQWFYLEGEEPKKDPVTDEDRIGNIKLKKRLMVEMWENDAPPDVNTAQGGEGEEDKLPDKPAATEGRDSEVCAPYIYSVLFFAPLIITFITLRPGSLNYNFHYTAPCCATSARSCRSVWRTL